MSKRDPNLLTVREHPEPPACECGCGEKVAESIRQRGRWNRFVIGHQTRGRVLSAESRAKIAKASRRPKGEQSPLWKGGRRVNSHGYVEVFRPDHPRVRGNGYVFEHILVMEQVLGRPIACGEHVHHQDRNKHNNSPENLQLVTPSEHSRIHTRKPRLVRLTCEVCGKPFLEKESHIASRKTCGFGCAGELFREYYTGNPRGYRPTEDAKREALERVKQRGVNRQVGERSGA